ncbi:cell division protein FtsZ [Halomonas shantousis]
MPRQLDHPPTEDLLANLKVVGVGGGGSNTILHIIQSNSLQGIDAFAANTDLQALKSLPQSAALPIGNNTTRGLGAGANPELGTQAAEESRSTIQARLAGADMVFITAGMGGGTGTGAAPVIAEIAQEMGILTVAVVTRPFSFEGGKRRQAAEAGIAALERVVDSLIVIPNDRLMQTLGKGASLLSAFAAVNDVLKNAVSGIAEVITSPGMINVDFADVKAVMQIRGRAKIGTGTGQGEGRARQAALAAVKSPLIEEYDIKGAGGVLVNITAGRDISIGEFNEIGETIREFTSDEATVVIGTSLSNELHDAIRVSIVAAGLQETSGVAAQGETASARQSPSRSAPGHQQPTSPGTKSRQQDGKQNSDYLDIPAFLRRPSE